MIRLKHGVDLRGIQPEMLFALQVVHTVYEENNVVLVVTSALDGKHKPDSLHYSGYALDFRTRHMPLEVRTLIAVHIAVALGKQYDVVLEDTHLHVEFDPDN